MKIRGDIYRNLSDVFLRRKIPGYRDSQIMTWIKEAHKGLDSQFHSLEDFVKYINGIKKPEDAERLIDIGQFYMVSKRYVDANLPYVKLIMMVSIIESLMSESGYIEFHAWLTQRNNPAVNEYLNHHGIANSDDFRKAVKALHADYSELYGSRRNVVKFFDSYFGSEDKIRLIKSFIVYRDGKAQKIWEDQLEKQAILSKNLKKTVDLIYQMRSDFVHAAGRPIFLEKGDADYVGATQMIGNLPAVVELAMEELERMFEDALRRYFDER